MADEMRELVVEEIRNTYNKTYLDELGLRYLNFARRQENKEPLPYEEMGGEHLTPNQLNEVLIAATNKELLYMFDGLACQRYR